MKTLCLGFLNRLLAGGCVFLFAVQPGDASVVTDCTEANLRSAVEGGGVVTFACDGTIVLNNALVISADLVVDGGGRAITLSGNDTTPVFAVGGDRRLTLLNLTIANGRSANGGAIGNDGGVINASNCVFSGNMATATNDAGGGAIFNRNGWLTLQRCVFSDNKVLVTGVAGTGTNGGVGNWLGGTGGPGGAAIGGGIWNLGQATLEDCYFIRNACTGGIGGTGGMGGGFYGINGWLWWKRRCCRRQRCLSLGWNTSNHWLHFCQQLGDGWRWRNGRSSGIPHWLWRRRRPRRRGHRSGNSRGSRFCFRHKQHLVRQPFDRRNWRHRQQRKFGMRGAPWWQRRRCLRWRCFRQERRRVCFQQHSCPKRRCRRGGWSRRPG